MPAYGYAPPPPPPSASGPQPVYSHQPGPSYHPYHGQGRGASGGPSGRGRGNHYPSGHGRPDYNAPQPAHYEYTGQPYPGHHPPLSYAGAHPPPGSFAPAQAQWHPDQGHPPPQHAHAPAPISSSNYHPNYTQQPYPPPQYPQQAPYAPPQPYGQPYQGSPAPPQWNGQGHTQPAPYGNGRSRGGYNDRGGSKLGMPMRGGYEAEQPPPLNGAYAQPYPPDPRASYPPPQYHYAAPPPPPPSSYHDGHRGNNFGRGRGGGNRGGNFRGRGGHNAGGRQQNHKHGQHDGHGGHGNNKQQQHETGNVGKKKKRKTNTLGLTPGMESDSDDDEGEEKALETLLGHERYQVDDISEFLAERKKNFPTKARVESKKAAELAHKGNDADTALHKKRDKLRKQLAKVESSIKRKRELGDEGDEMRDLSLNDSEDDGKPEVMSSRSPAAPPPPPPAKKADVSRHCKYFSTGGTCGKKSKCRFVHDPEVREAAIKEREANNGRLTIQQRLILNDKEQEDLSILESIQYLRGKGVMKREAVAEEKEDENLKSPRPVAAPTATKSSLLPAASASLPPPPPKKEPAQPRREQPPPSIIPTRDSIDRGGIQHYEGWLLEPYGSTSGKQPNSDDLP